jgi:dGTPase
VNTERYPVGQSCPPFKPWAPPKCIHNEEAPLLEWLLAPFPAADREEFLRFDLRDGKHGRTRHKTLEASIVELADDIAYGTHDVEDAFFSRLITPEEILPYMPLERFGDPGIFDRYSKLIMQMGRGAGGSKRDSVFEKKEASSALISKLVTAAKLDENELFEHPRLRWNATLPSDDRIVLDALKDAVYDRVINGPAVQSLEHRGGIIIESIFRAFHESPELLGGKHGHLLREAENEEQRLRTLADYIAGMTDTYAERTYNRLFQPGSGSVFDRI